MKILNFGSLNIDHVYGVEHFVRPGETIQCENYNQYCGGKGLNQSIALALSGSKAYHAGKTGNNGGFLIERLKMAGVNTDFVYMDNECATGHAVIQVDKSGQNSIMIWGGANRNLTKQETAKILDHFSADDCLLLQNEINRIPEIIHRAREKNMTIFFNPAPMNPDVLSYPLNEINYLIINETEGMELTGMKDPDEIIDKILHKFPGLSVILTLGENGVVFADIKERLRIPSEKITPIDTTAAGDTFTGYFITEIMDGKPVIDCLKLAVKAAAICITRHGAADSIPSRNEIDNHK
jgi:ribokinase